MYNQDSSFMDRLPPREETHCLKIIELETRIAQLEQYIKQMPPVSTIIIENLYLHKLCTDELKFVLDNLEVKELSGILNIGVNNCEKMKQEKK